MQYINQRIQLVAAIQQHNELFALTADPALLAELAAAQEQINQEILQEMECSKSCHDLRGRLLTQNWQSWTPA